MKVWHVSRTDTYTLQICVTFFWQNGKRNMNRKNKCHAVLPSPDKELNSLVPGVRFLSGRTNVSLMDLEAVRMVSE